MPFKLQLNVTLSELGFDHVKGPVSFVKGDGTQRVVGASNHIFKVPVYGGILYSNLRFRVLINPSRLTL